MGRVKGRKIKGREGAQAQEESVGTQAHGLRDEREVGSGGDGRGSQVSLSMVHDSRLAVHGLRFTIRSSRFTIRSSRFTNLGSQFTTIRSSRFAIRGERETYIYIYIYREREREREREKERERERDSDWKRRVEEDIGEIKHDPVKSLQMTDIVSAIL